MYDIRCFIKVFNGYVVHWIRSQEDTISNKEIIDSFIDEIDCIGFIKNKIDLMYYTEHPYMAILETFEVDESLISEFKELHLYKAKNPRKFKKFLKDNIQIIEVIPFRYKMEHYWK